MIVVRLINIPSTCKATPGFLREVAVLISWTTMFLSCHFSQKWTQYCPQNCTENCQKNCPKVFKNPLFSCCQLAKYQSKLQNTAFLLVNIQNWINFLLDDMTRIETLSLRTILRSIIEKNDPMKDTLWNILTFNLKSEA